jgi:parvulin-like peptidyl-prolyl isomerase
MTTTRFFKNGETVDDVLKFSPMLHERIVWMKPGDISPPITVSGKLLVFEVVKKTDQDKEIFESRKDQIETTLIESARNNFFNGYIKNVVDRLRENEQIQINQELLAEFSNN